MPFYGLPLEILQHIASFLPFHGLVRLYTCLPKVHRPIFQLLLDHSLALMMLTLEIRQQSDEQPPMRDSFFVSLNNNPNGVGAARKLQTHWRVTDFDMDRMRVEFQLEEKLGLEMAERRRVEVESQIRQQLQLQQKGRKQGPWVRSQNGEGEEEEDIENLIWRTRTGGMSSSSSTSSLSGTLAGETGEAGEAGGLERRPSEVIEFSDSNFFHCTGSSHTPTLGSATVSFKAQRNMPAPWVSQNFDFGVDHSAPSSSTSSQSSGSSSSSLSSSVAVAVETPAMIRARERVAAYQQNRLLLRALAKMRSCEESSRLQFLPVTVELETEELGQKKVEAEVVDGAGASVRRRTTSGLGKGSAASAGSGGISTSAVKLGRRHSWQALEPSNNRPSTSAQHHHHHHHSHRRHHSALEPLLNFGSDLSSHGLTKALKRILRRTSWNGNSSSQAHTATAAVSTPYYSSYSSSYSSLTGCSACDPYHQHHYYNQYQRQYQHQHQQPQRRSMDSLRTVDWSSVFHSVASSMHRSSSSSSHSTTSTATTTGATTVGCQCSHRKAVLLTTSKQLDPSALAAAKAATPTALVPKRRSFSNMVTGYRKGKAAESPSSSVDKGKGKGKATINPTAVSTSPSSQEQQQEEKHQKLFEFSYGVRHNYLHSHRLEGERVIRPMRFACSLDFFIQD
ncbi:hypothetical protein BGZ97_012216 [Linnemannia gamsii]|uniref:F-box domain-containing protein n=1 Tax=Linnemannia gamsii TaxID=64522 RepID=A0A9P6UU76_9FUNG|nr:hypothetical protein BGZ97_012216 [Linnemannia gamsii]